MRNYSQEHNPAVTYASQSLNSNTVKEAIHEYKELTLAAQGQFLF